MRVNRENLLRTLELVSPGLTPKDTVEQSSCLIFINGRVCTFDDEILCSADSPLGTFTGAVSAKPLLDLLSKLSEDEVDVDSDKDHKKLVVKGKNRRAKITMEEKVTSQLGSVDLPEAWLPLHQDFSESISVVSSCAAAKATDFIYTCVHITPQFVEASDRFQIARYPLTVGVTEDVLVRAASIVKMVSLDMKEIAESPSWLHFRDAKGLVFSCRKFLDKYKNMDKWLDSHGATPIQLPGGLDEVVAKAEIFSVVNAAGNYLQINLKPPEVLEVVGKGALGNYQEMKRITYDGPPMSFVLAPKTLLSLCKKSNECGVLPGRLFAVSQKFSLCICVNAPEDLQPVKREVVSGGDADPEE